MFISPYRLHGPNTSFFYCILAFNVGFPLFGERLEYGSIIGGALQSQVALCCGAIMVGWAIMVRWANWLGPYTLLALRFNFPQFGN